MVFYRLSIALVILSISIVKAMYVEWPFLNPNWELDKMLFLVTYLVILMYISLSNIFENTGSTEMGL